MRTMVGFKDHLESFAPGAQISNAVPAGGATADSHFEARLSQTIESYDSNAETYTTRFQHVDLSEHRRRFLKRLPSPTGLLLDAGCGPGRDLRLFAQDGFRAIGLDRSAGLLGIARSAGHDVVEGDLRDIPFKSGSFAGVWACASLLHLSIAELASALAEFKRVLRPDGNLFASVRYGFGVEERPDESGHKRWFYLYSAPDIEQVLLQSGFVDIEAKVEPGAAHGTWVNIHARSGSACHSYSGARRVGHE